MRNFMMFMDGVGRSSREREKGGVRGGEGGGRKRNKIK